MRSPLDMTGSPSASDGRDNKSTGTAGAPADEASADRTNPSAEETAPYQPPAEEGSGGPDQTVSGPTALSNLRRWPVIPGYEILDELGRGGMGVVYRARQLSAKRVVALKVIRSDRLEGLAPAQRRDWLQRFQTEAQTAARVSHEHAVAVYEVGEVDGQPFYSMHYVEGKSLARVLRDGLLANQRAAAWLEQVARAIHSVHLCGILHRDIKPGNILIDDNERPLVTDFGLAKWVQGGASRAAISAPSGEQTGGGVGTPEFMAPEQAWDSARVTAASDVYSLGATLYASLTGRPPFQAAEPIETMRQLVDKDPVPLRQLNPAIARDLETIALKCLQKEPAKRYASALDLADDLRRYQDGKPILARPVGPVERALKWVRRNRALTALLLAVLALLAGSTGAAFWYQNYLGETARKQLLDEQAIRHSLHEARRVHGQLVADLKKPGGVQELLSQRSRYAAQIQLARAGWQHASEIADRAGAGLASDLTDLLQNLDIELTSAQAEHDLAVRLEKVRMDQAAWVERRFDYKTAAAEYPKAFAAAGLDVLSGDRDVLVKRLAAMPIKEEVVAALDDWALVGYHLGNHALTTKLLAVVRGVAPDRDWGDQLRQLDTWRSQDKLARLAGTAPSTGLSPQLLAMLGTLLAKENPMRITWLRQAQARFPTDFWLNNDLAYALRDSDRDESAGFYRVALMLRPDSSVAHNNLGVTLTQQKKWREAITCLQSAIALDPKFATAHCNLGNVFFHQKKLPEAINCQRQALALDPELPSAYIGLGSALCEQKKMTEGIAAHRKAIALDRNYVMAYINLGSALGTEQKLTEAAQAYRDAIGIDPKSSAAYTGLGLVLHGQAKLDEAVAAYHQAIALDPKDPLPRNNLGNTLYAQHKLSEAEAAYRKAIELDPKYAMAYVNLGAVLRAQRKLSEAVAAYQQAIDLEPTRAVTYYNLGNVLDDQQRLPEAVAAFRKAIALEPSFAQAHCNLGHALLAQGEMAQALAAFRRGDELGRRRPRWTDPSAEWVRNAERLARLETNLPAILSRKQQPADAEECIQYAQVCHPKGLYVSAARLYEQAFKAERRLADDLKAANRYNAACAACLAGAGKGKESGQLDDKQRARWRQQALAWLNADLALWAKQLKDAAPHDRAAAQQALSRWQEDTDLAGIRASAALEKLPAAEQAACRKLWADVAALLKKIMVPSRQTKDTTCQSSRWRIAAYR